MAILTKYGELSSALTWQIWRFEWSGVTETRPTSVVLKVRSLVNSLYCWWPFHGTSGERCSILWLLYFAPLPAYHVRHRYDPADASSRFAHHLILYPFQHHNATAVPENEKAGSLTRAQKHELLESHLSNLTADHQRQLSHRKLNKNVVQSLEQLFITLNDCDKKYSSNCRKNTLPVGRS